MRHLHHGAMVDAYDGNDHVVDDDDDDDDVLVHRVYVGYSDSDKDHDVGAASGVWDVYTVGERLACFRKLAPLSPQ